MSLKQGQIEIKHQEERPISINGIDSAYDTFGNPSSPAVILVSGLGGQLISWDEDFCRFMGRQGFYIVRFDNRDSGIATKFDSAGNPSMLALVKALRGKPVFPPPYTIQDMAEDTLALADALGLDTFHIVGISMGGMIAQEVAIRRPERVRSLTSIMSAPVGLGLPIPGLKVISILTAPFTDVYEEYIEAEIKSRRTLQGEKIPFDVAYARKFAEAFYRRGVYPGCMPRQLSVVLASPSREEGLSRLKMPALVIHGKADPLIPFSFGERTAALIPDAQFLPIPGMGHGLAPLHLDLILETMAQHFRKAEERLL